MTKLAYTYQEAAEATGISVEEIKKAVRRGDLIPSYPTTRPVIRAVELERWLESMPAEPVRR